MREAIENEKVKVKGLTSKGAFFNVKESHKESHKNKDKKKKKLKDIKGFGDE